MLLAALSGQEPFYFFEEERKGKKSNEVHNLTIGLQIMETVDVTQALEQLEVLVASECYTSASMLGGYLLAATRRDTPPLQRVAVLIATADALRGTDETQRAAERYEEALQVLRRMPQHGGGGCKSATEARAAFAAAKCRYALHEADPLGDSRNSRMAMEHMERIGRSYESLGAVLFLARMKMDDDSKSVAARDLYLRALEINPLALEAVDRLALLAEASAAGARRARGESDVAAVDYAARLACDARMTAANREWSSTLAKASQLRVRNEPTEALALLTSVEECHFAECPQLLRLKAELHMDLYEPEAAERHFAEMRRLDPLYIDGLDRYASLLFRRNESAALQTLTSDMMRVDAARAETWNTAALWCELQQETEKALNFLDKALALAPQRPFSLLVKGHVLLTAVRQEIEAAQRQVSALLCTVTLFANHAHHLTRSP
jgi:tetratricopeptide (TPR) repeat protein